MLFNSSPFVFVFLPLAAIGFHIVRRAWPGLARLWLLAASAIFYAWWGLDFAAILAASIVFNFWAGNAIAAGATQPARQSRFLAFGVAANLALLFYAKYLLATLVVLNGAPLPAFERYILFPIGVSFFTFTQIGYLADRRDGTAPSADFLSYALFVSFFPSVISGPILRGRELLPQIADIGRAPSRSDDISVGMTLFVIGLFKKAFIADQIHTVPDAGFAHPEQLKFFGAWTAALYYSLQLYFDFSGYSDMAIGTARLFGLKLPLNFDAPYRALSIVDFWQRWHMSLTRFITRYIFNPLALHAARRRAMAGLKPWNRQNADFGGFVSLVAFPMLVTMLLAGIWHGAGMQFAVFGLLHAIYLTANHAWRTYGPRTRMLPRVATVTLSWAATYLAVLVAQIFFRASSAGGALSLLAGMAGAHGIEQTSAEMPLPKDVRILVLVWAVVLLAPTSQRLLADFSPSLSPVAPGRVAMLQWRPNIAWALVMGLALFGALATIGQPSEFFYFKF